MARPFPNIYEKPNIDVTSSLIGAGFRRFNQMMIALGALKKAQKPDKPSQWIRQIVSVTRSTDKDGKILSGIPQVIDIWVPRLWNQSDDEWASSVFNKAAER